MESSSSFMTEFQHLVIKLAEITSATGEFSANQVIGSGGFGNVYKGVIYHSKGQSLVAIKRLDDRHGQGNAEFWKELMIVSHHIHQNLISLLRYCDEGGEKIVVYEHAPRGSLDHHLSSTDLSWMQHISICLDAARGICYLHDDNDMYQRVCLL